MNSTKTILAVASACIALTLLPGCAIISWTVAAFAPPEKIPAKYTLPKDKRLLVFVDDYTNPISYEPLKERMTKEINDWLLDEKAVKEVVAYEKLFRLVTATPEFHSLSIVEVAKRVKADVVVYVLIDSFSLKDTPDIALWHGKMKTRVRVVDVSGDLLWPIETPDGFEIPELDLPEAVDSSPAYGTELANKMGRIMSKRVASLFFEHEAPRTHLGEKE